MFSLFSSSVTFVITKYLSANSVPIKKNLRFDAAGDRNNLMSMKPKEVNMKTRKGSSELDEHALPCGVWLETPLT